MKCVFYKEVTASIAGTKDPSVRGVRCPLLRRCEVQIRDVYFCIPTLTNIPIPTRTRVTISAERSEPTRAAWPVLRQRCRRVPTKLYVCTMTTSENANACCKNSWPKQHDSQVLSLLTYDTVRMKTTLRLGQHEWRWKTRKMNCDYENWSEKYESACL